MEIAMDWSTIVSLVVVTAIVNGVTILIANPLAQKWYQELERRMRVVNAQMPMPGQFIYKPLWGKVKFIREEFAEEKLSKLAETCFILTDIAILAIVGFLSGLLGFAFIGIPLSGKALPGMIAFIVMSFLGLGLTHGGLF
jgi:hypothetical protein